MKKWRHMERGGYESQWTVPFFFSKLVPNDERFLHISRQQGHSLPRWAKALLPAVKQSCLCPQLGLIFLYTEHFHFYFFLTWLLTSAAFVKVTSFHQKMETRNLKFFFISFVQAISSLFGCLAIFGVVLFSASVYLKMPAFY